MDIINYIVDNALVLIPALVIIGAIVKHIEVIPDKFIPLILLVFGVGGALAIIGPHRGRSDPGRTGRRRGGVRQPARQADGKE